MVLLVIFVVCIGCPIMFVSVRLCTLFCVFFVLHVRFSLFTFSHGRWDWMWERYQIPWAALLGWNINFLTFEKIGALTDHLDRPCLLRGLATNIHFGSTVTPFWILRLHQLFNCMDCDVGKPDEVSLWSTDTLRGHRICVGHTGTRHTLGTSPLILNW